jgi:hypothetical protein
MSKKRIPRAVVGQTARNLVARTLTASSPENLDGCRLTRPRLLFRFQIPPRFNPTLKELGPQLTNNRQRLFG